MEKVELHGDDLGLVHPISEPSQYALKCLRLLGARNRPLPLDDICRDGRDTELGGSESLISHFLSTLVGSEKSEGVGSICAELLHEFSELIGITNVVSVGEVRRKK